MRFMANPKDNSPARLWPAQLDTFSSSRFLPAFTLVELLVVIAILGLLAGLTTTAVGRARSSSLAAKDMANLKQTTSLVLLATQERGIIIGSKGEAGGLNWVLDVDDVFPGTLNGEVGGIKNWSFSQNPNHIYLCPTLLAMRPYLTLQQVRHQWAINSELIQKPLAAVPRPSKTVLLTTAVWRGLQYGWGQLEFIPAERLNPDLPYPARRLSTTDPSTAKTTTPKTLMAFVDGHIEIISQKDPTYFPVNTGKPAWTP